MSGWVSPERVLREHFPPGASAVPLKGDASTRRFFRIQIPNSPPGILMLYPEAFAWEGSALEGNHRHLEAVGVPVPKIERVFPEAGAVFLEDLGDTTLQMALDQNPSFDRTVLYQEAIRIIAILQERGTRELPAGAVARQSALDGAKFLWELEHFYEHFILGYRQAHPAGEEELLFSSFFGWLAASLDSAPRALCHRDFQSRNLMLTSAGLRVIDYQDARMGPASYDLASLLRDSSLDLAESFREEGIRYFLSRRRDLPPEEFREEFGRQALQRNIKDLGTFGRQVHLLGNEGYRQYIPRTLRMVREAMLRDQRYHTVFPLFEKYVFTPADE
ncbi:MAG: phosphotransferase [Acidobacteria bacterium]|nr:phosphotransferase [Acidobacteriota bacterium]